MKTGILALFLGVDLLGIFGTILVAVPFLREHKLKALLEVLRRDAPIPGLARATIQAEQSVMTELGRFKPGDGAYVGWGVIVVGLSYGLHIVAELLEHFAH